jgi:hypothetical protein
MGKRCIDISVVSLENSDFYVTAATVIPVIFLGLVLEGGFWAWIAERITSGGDLTRQARYTISGLQLGAMLIVGLGMLGELLALYALFKGRSNPLVGNLVYFSTAALVVMLGLLFILKVPGLGWSSFAGLSPELEDGEHVREKMGVYRWVSSLYPWSPGVLFLTNRRIVWLTMRATGIMGASRLSIRLTNLDSAADYKEPIWSRLMKKLVPYSNIPSGCCINVKTLDDHSYKFSMSATRASKIMEYLQMNQRGGERSRN